MIINTSTSSQVNIWNLTFNNEGASTNPSGAQKISLLNGIGNLIGDYTPTEFSAGVFYTTIPVSALGNGYYNLIGQSVDGAVTSEVPDALTISNIKGVGDIDKAYVSTYKVITTYTDIIGGLADTTSTKIYLFKDDSIVPVINGVDMTKISTGKYGYDLNISALAEGFYFILFEHIYDGKTYGAGFHTSITNSISSTHNLSNTGKSKVFDDNLLLSADTITEPTAKMAVTDVMDYVKDGRVETYVSLTDTAGQTHTFEYIFNAAVDLNFVQIKGCDAKTYTVSIDEGTGYETLITGSFAEATDFIVWYSATAKSITKIKYVFTSEKYDDTLTIKVGELIALTQLHEWHYQPQHFPVPNTKMSKEQNWFGAYHVNKNRSWTECEINFNFLNEVMQADIDMIMELRKRTTPFYYWINGGVANANFYVMTDSWKQENILRVYEVSEKWPEHHVNNVDITGALVGQTLQLVEAAFVEAN